LTDWLQIRKKSRPRGLPLGRLKLFDALSFSK
jgi:hypothetical protein